MLAELVESVAMGDLAKVHFLVLGYFKCIPFSCHVINHNIG